jgi:hypothetical protein
MDKCQQGNIANQVVINVRRSSSKVSVENCSLLGYYAAGSGNFLQTFRDNLSVPSSGLKNPKESL